MFFAVASGACAAFNGVFAKLYVVFFYKRRLSEGRWDELIDGLGRKYADDCI